MSISATYVSQLTVVRTSGGPFVGSDNTTTVNGLNTSTALGAATTPAVTKDAEFNVTLSTGTATIDFTNITDADLGTVTLTGLSIQFIKFKNAAAAAMTIAKGASNGLTGLGSAFSITIPPGGEVTFYGADGAANVGSGDKTLDITGTGSQVLGVQVVAG